jgi:hypothetical protein
MQTVSTGTSVLLLAGVAAGLTVGRPLLRDRVGEEHAARVRVQFAWPPLAPQSESRLALAAGEPNTWLDAENRSRLEILVRQHVSADLFDAESLRRAQEALMRTGWFATRCRLRREAGGVVTVRGMWRVPAAVVRWADVDRVVSARGELLDADFPKDGSGLKVILGATANPPDLGEAWLGGEVQAGLSLLAYLRSSPPPPWASQIYGIDASDFTQKKRLTIVTERGTRIVWGGRPGEFSPGQAKDSAKRERLDRMFRETGRIDAGREVCDISLASGF